MAATKLERARGTRDFAAEDALLRQQIVETLRSVFELYGYNPLETPVIEKFETLASKYAGGEEILKETFKLKDQGGRELGLRYDLTVPMCRFIATNPNLKIPFKRYQIGSVFRDGPLKTGRYREFMQCDVDIVGVKSMAADAEMIEIARDAFSRLFKDTKLKIEVRINNRKLLDAILKAYGVKEGKIETVILSLDKLEKFGKDYVIKELGEKGVGKEIAQKIVYNLGEAGSNDWKISNIRKDVGDNEGLTETAELLQLVNGKSEERVKNGEVERVLFITSLARGLAYYTGTVFEIFLKNSEITSAVAAGGRYDKMIGNFVGSGREYPAVGISFGLDVIEDALGAVAKEKRRTTTAVYVIPIKAVAEAKKIAAKLRSNGVNTDIDLSGRDVKKNLEYAAAAGIPYAVFIGEEEVKEGKVKVRDMRSGKEETLSVSEFANKLGSDVMKV